MGKKKKKVKTTVYISLEGVREKAFYDYLEEALLTKDSNINITISPKRGGTSDTILQQAIKMKDCYDRVYAWFDEDVSLSDEMRKKLAEAWGYSQFPANIKDSELQRIYNNSGKKKPFLIVSTPCCVDGMLIKICNKQLPVKPSTFKCKSAISGIMGKRGVNEEIEKQYYRDNLSIDNLRTRTDIEALPIIFTIFEEENSKITKIFKN